MNIMIFWDIFVNSIKLPNVQAMKRLNKVGMDFTVFYMFILLFIASVPSFLEQLFGSTGPDLEISFFFFILYFFMFFYLPFVIIIFGVLSLLAYIAVIITEMVNRKLRFPILWKLMAYTTTIPLLLYTTIALFYDFSMIYLGLTAIYSLTLVIIMILSFPRRRTK